MVLGKWKGPRRDPRVEGVQQALVSPVRVIIVGIPKGSRKDFGLHLYLDSLEIVGEVRLLLEASREGKLVKQRTWGGLRVVVVVVA